MENFDYNAFWARMQELYTIDSAIAYAIYRGDEKQSQFQNILRAIGFEENKPFTSAGMVCKRGLGCRYYY